MASKFIRCIFGARVLLATAALLLLAVAAQPGAWAWDAGTESRTHNAKPGTGGENPISILDTRPKWADSVGLNSSRVADCPSGYTNTGLTCSRAADTQAAPSVLASCPSGYTNTGVSCYREPYIYAAASVNPICPTDYYYNGFGGCTRDAFIYSAPSRAADCPSGYTNTGVSCLRGADTYSAPSRVADCTKGTNFGLFCSLGGSFTCPSGYFVNSSLGRCYVNCRSGYTNTGEFCSRGASSISLSNASCPSGYFQGAIAGRCNKTCNAGFTNTGEFCQRNIDIIATSNSSVSCPAGYFKGLAGRCNKTCDAGFTNTGEFCQRDADTIALSNATCPVGYFQGLVGRCNKSCPAGYTNTGETCFRPIATLGKEAMTCQSNEDLIDIVAPRCYAKPACPAGYEYFALRCYVQAVATGPGGSVERTAVSTIVHRVKQSGNTHLWVVDRALDLLGKSAQNGSPLRALVDAMNAPAVRLQWEQGLWDGDAPAYVDADGHQGTHFYNAALLDRKGAFTPLRTYLGALDNKFACKNARECAATQLKYLAGFSLDQKHPQSGKLVAYHLGLALHYMTDVTQPMHSSGWSGLDIPTNGHPQWEYYVPYVQELFTTDSMSWNPRSLDWTNAGHNLNDPDLVLYRAALKSNAFAPRLSAALNIDGGAGIVTIQGFNGIGPYTGYNFYNDSTVDALTGEILRDAYQSTAAYLAAVASTYYSAPVSKTCDVDGNGIVDRLDLNAIMAGRNAPATGSADPRDADGNGVIDANDARQCALKCSYASCASSAP